MQKLGFKKYTRSQRKRTVDLMIRIFLLLAVLIIVGTILIKSFEKKQNQEIVESSQNIDVNEEFVNLVRYDGKWYKQNPKLDTLLLIGVDDMNLNNAENSKQADFLLVVAIDKENSSYKALQINRDTMADVPQLDMYGAEYGIKNQQIALAFAHSNDDLKNCNNTVKAVSNLLYGVDIKNYICVSMDAVPEINDLVGGVPVYVEDDFSNTDPSIVQGTTVILQGEQALHFVRARSSMDEPTNTARMERQRTYMRSLHEQAIKKAGADSNFIMDSLFSLSERFASNCSINQMSDMFNVALAQGASDILTIDGEAVQGREYMEFYPDEQALQKQVIEMFFTEDKTRQ